MVEGSGIERAEAILEAHGFARVAYYGKRVWTLACIDCGVQFKIPGLATNAPPNVLITYAHRRGWSVERARPPRCKACETARRRGPMTMKDETSTQAIIVAANQPSMPNSKIALRVFRRLDETFDETTRRYRNGMTDAKIASEIGIAEEVVSKLRREAYGELAEAPEVTELREALAQLRLQFEGDFTALKQLYDSAFADLAARIHAVSRGERQHHKAAG